jgi:L-asparaginase/Glu-tRNA(Gln) amidotransferase subunit D
MSLLMMTGVAAFAEELPKVTVLSTDGTIASKHDAVKGGYVPALSGEDLVVAVPAIKRSPAFRSSRSPIFQVRHVDSLGRQSK